MNRLLLLLVGAAGSLMLWGAVTDRNPRDILKALATNTVMPEPGSWTNTLKKSGSSGGLPNIPGAPSLKDILPKLPLI